MTSFIKKCLIITVTIFTSLLEVNAQNQRDNESIETLTISYNRAMKSVNDSLTRDNTIIFTDQVSSAPYTVGSILTTATGTSLNGQGGLFQSYNIRGFSRARIKTEVDGIPIITDRRAGNAISFIPTELISNVNIQKGPQSSLYGSGAMGGVVSISTKHDEQRALTLTVQPNNNAQHVYINNRISNININLIHRQADNEKSSERVNNNSELNTHYRQSVASISSELTWQDIDIFASAIISQGDDIGKSSANFPEQRITDYPTDDHLLSQITLTHADKWQLKFYQHHQNWQTDIARIDEGLVTRRNVTSYTADTIGTYGSWLINSTVIGAEWLGRRNIRISEAEFNNNNEQQWQHMLVDAKEDTYAVFAVHNWTLNDINLETGIRYDNINLSQAQQHKADNFLSLSTHLDYAVSSSTQLSFQVANAFRFPSVSELFFSGETPRGNTQGNIALKPEKSMGYQLTVKHIYSPRVSASVKAYHYKIDDYIERYTADNIRYYRNSEQVQITGFELDTQWNINSAWRSSLGLQWQQAYDSENNTVDDSIPKALKWSLVWQNDKLAVTQQMHYQFSQSHVGTSELPRESALTWNMSVDYQMTKAVNIRVSVINLTDNLYRASSDEDAAFQPQRTVNLTGIWHF